MTVKLAWVSGGWPFTRTSPACLTSAYRGVLEDLFVFLDVVQQQAAFFVLDFLDVVQEESVEGVHLGQVDGHPREPVRLLLVCDHQLQRRAFEEQVFRRARLAHEAAVNRPVAFRGHRQRTVEGRRPERRGGAVVAEDRLFGVEDAPGVRSACVDVFHFLASELLDPSEDLLAFFVAVPQLAVVAQARRVDVELVGQHHGVVPARRDLHDFPA